MNLDATDTDGDGLADGQELYVKSVKTPKRYPIKDQTFVSTDPIDLGLASPAWAIARADAMVGFTHEDMGQIVAWLRGRTAGVNDRTVSLRFFSNIGEANHFTSYDLLQAPALGAGISFLRQTVPLDGSNGRLKKVHASGPVPPDVLVGGRSRRRSSTSRRL